MFEPRTGVDVEVRRGVARVFLNRPEVANAIDRDAALALGSVLENLSKDDSVRCVVVGGRGGRFCAGGDLGAMVEAPDRSVYLHDSAAALDSAIMTLESMDKPVVAAVHGAVAGAGVALMLACDVIIADARTVFVAGYDSVGLTPDCGLSWLLPRAIGQVRSLEFLLTGRTISAAEAVTWGLITEVAEGAAIDRASELADQLSRGSRAGLGQTRRLVRGSWTLNRQRAGEVESRAIARVVGDLETARRLDDFAKARATRRSEKVVLTSRTHT